MKLTFHLTLLLSAAVLFSSCSHLKKTNKSQNSLQNRQLDALKQKGWYFCILDIQTDETHHVKYMEVYPDNKQSAYRIHSDNEQSLYFHPGHNQFSFYTPSESAQFQSNLTSRIQQVRINEIKYKEHTFDLSQLEKGPMKNQVQLNKTLSFHIVCDYSTNEFSPTRNIEHNRYWILEYTSLSHPPVDCSQTQERNSLSLEAKIFSFENHQGEYPDDFQIPVPLKYEQPFDSYKGVIAYGNKKRGKYQCTELVHRFFRTVYNVPTKIGLGLGHGKDLSLNLTKRANQFNPAVQTGSQEIPLKFVFIDNGCSSQLPVAGSTISFSWRTYGHVAIVRKVEMLTEEIALLHLFQQSGTRVLLEDSRHLIVKDHEGHWRGKDVIGWSIPVKK